MKIGIASHIVKDSIIDIEGNKIESLGGPACYGSTIAKTFKVDVIIYLLKQVAISLIDLEFLKKNNIHYREMIKLMKNNPTTRFQLVLNKEWRMAEIYFSSSKCSHY